MEYEDGSLWVEKEMRREYVIMEWEKKINSYSQIKRGILEFSHFVITWSMCNKKKVSGSRWIRVKKNNNFNIQGTPSLSKFWEMN